MLAQFRLMARRYGIVNKIVSVPADPQTDDEIVRVYAGAITPRTRLLMVSHMINVTGQILPVRKIADMAHAQRRGRARRRRARVCPLRLQDSRSRLRLLRRVTAQVARLPARHRHPLRPARQDPGAVADLRRLADDRRHRHHEAEPHRHASGAHRSRDRRTRSRSTRRSASSARKRGSATCRHYWTSKVRALPNVILNTPSDPARTCAIANVGVKGVTPDDLAKTLLDKYRIWTNAVDSDRRRRARRARDAARVHPAEGARHAGEGDRRDRREKLAGWRAGSSDPAARAGLKTGASALIIARRRPDRRSPRVVPAHSTRRRRRARAAASLPRTSACPWR